MDVLNEVQEVKEDGIVDDSQTEDNAKANDTIANDGNAKLIKFVLIDTSTLGRNGWRYLISGANIDNFKKNPIMLYMHNRDYGWNDSVNKVIGKWQDIQVEGNKIVASALFDMADEYAAKVAGKVERGFLNAVSVGVHPIEWSFEEQLMLPNQTGPTITKWDVLESSIVDIPNFPGSIRNYAQNGLELNDLPKPPASTEIERLVIVAKNKGILNATNEANFRNLLAIDFENAKAFIEKSTSVRTKISDMVQNQSEDDSLAGEYKRLMNSPDKLLELKTSNPEHYTQIANAYVKSTKPQ